MVPALLVRVITRTRVIRYGMRSGRCTKCAATTIRAARNGVQFGASLPSLHPNLEPGFRGMARPQQADVWTFVCLTCGYLEWGLFDPDALAFVNERWSEVPVTPS
jgi:hypothetical protein